ncbi:hypothetical protein ACSBL2_14065 [Pedobacter sp. AW31-3R]|uniref:hypothetical protein n=1 Tax=Pedobacter sp. AW31-3R TaxID=3445781 RepID=UPI003FA0DEC7
MIEPMIYDYDPINRNALFVKAKKPFYDWINYIDPEFPVVDNDEGTVYLIKELDTQKKLENWLKKHFDEIFRNELNGYHTDPEDWPQTRTFKVFKEWFSVEISSMVVDMLETPILKQE